MHQVVAATEKGMAYKVQPWTYSSDQFFTYPEEARALAGQIFGSSPDNIAIVPSASYGIQTAANILPIGPKQNILVLEDQFPSNIYPWQDRAAKEGAAVRLIPTPKDDNWTDVLLRHIDTNTAVVAIPQTHWASGATLDLKAIRTALDHVGGALVLDLTQSLGAQVFNSQDIRPDFAVVATYKWMMGPYSTGFLYVDPKWHEAAPLEHNWINREGSENFSGLTQYRDGFQPGARRFDMGEKSNAAQMLGASAAMRQILEWGIPNISETLAYKTQCIETELKETSVQPVSVDMRAPHYLCLRFPEGMPENLTPTLAEKQIFVSVRGDAMRITPHLYTDDHAIDRLIDTLKSTSI